MTKIKSGRVGKAWGLREGGRGSYRWAGRKLRFCTTKSSKLK